MTIPLINKEQIDQMSFSRTEVLNDEKSIQQRQKMLEKALTLGNLYKSHVRLTFVNSDGSLMRTVVTIWSVTDKYVALKGQMMVPIHCIQEIELVA